MFTENETINYGDYSLSDLLIYPDEDKFDPEDWITPEMLKQSRESFYRWLRDEEIM